MQPKKIGQLESNKVYNMSTRLMCNQPKLETLLFRQTMKISLESSKCQVAILILAPNLIWSKYKYLMPYSIGCYFINHFVIAYGYYYNFHDTFFAN